MLDDLIASLELTPNQVSALPAKLRKSLLDHLIRWQQFDSAHRCLDQLLTSHGRLLTVYDDLARL